MTGTGSVGLARAWALVLLATSASTGHAQAPINAGLSSESYRRAGNWPRLPEGRTLGRIADVAIDPDGRSVWAAEQCGGTSCATSDLAPILRFDQDGRLLQAFGARLFSRPHGIHVDSAGNVWVTDFEGANGKGHQVFKFSPEGRVLLVLGKAGIAGETRDTFNRPADVVVGPNGDIFVGDGHGSDSNARIVKFSRDGTFLKTWGQRGVSRGDFGMPHTMAFDSRGRLLVGDRSNNRIQVFDQDGRFLDEWRQFGRVSGIYVDGRDVVYAADSESNTRSNAGFAKGLRIGRPGDGGAPLFIPDAGADPDNTVGGEGVAVDAQGNVYIAYTDGRGLVKYGKR